MQPERAAQAIVGWLREQVRQAGAGGLVLGLSGGVDSAVVAALAVQAFPDRCLGLIMPCHSDPRDEQDARLVADRLGLATQRVDLAPLHDQVRAILSFPAGDSGAESERRRLADSNLKPRLRMMALYHTAARLGYLVAGTGNRSELEVGYFTKYGDGGVDLLPIGGLVKSEVRTLAEHLGIPRAIIEKPPSAGLWGGQTDEGEMGLTYEALDRYLVTGEADPAVRARVEVMRAASEHKRRLPPIGPVA